MSAGEMLLWIGSLGGALILWYQWYAPLGSVARLGAGRAGRGLFVTAPILGALVLAVILKTIASFDVVNDLRYLSMYFLLGAVWVGLALRMVPLVGLHPREDVVERGNAAAAPAVAGALLGLTLSFAGGNVGDGPGWWVVIFAAALATFGFFLAWLALELVGGASEAVTVERDAAAGWRLGGFLVAAGLVLGRGVAGDWVSSAATLRDFFAVVWPLVGLVIGAGVIDRAARPSVDRPASPITFGALPAALYVAGAAAYLATLPKP